MSGPGELARTAVLKSIKEQGVYIQRNELGFNGHIHIPVAYSQGKQSIFHSHACPCTHTSTNPQLFQEIEVMIIGTFFSHPWNLSMASHSLGAPQGPYLGKALSPQSSAVPSSGSHQLGGVMAFTGFLMSGAGDRSQLILLRTEHETSVFSVFTARTLLIPLPSCVLKDGIRLHG